MYQPVWYQVVVVRRGSWFRLGPCGEGNPSSCSVAASPVRYFVNYHKNTENISLNKKDKIT